MEAVIKWKNSVLANYLKRNGEDSISQDIIEHISDWLHSPEAILLHNRLQRISVPQAIEHSEKWVSSLIKKASIEEDLSGIEEVHLFSNNYKIVKINSKEAYQREGGLMGHCVASYYTRDDVDIYSLRDEENNPHCTFELRHTNGKKTIEQVKGKGNKEVAQKYRPFVLDFLKNSKVEIDEIKSNDINKYTECFVLGRNIFDFKKQNDKVLELKGNIEWSKHADKNDIYPHVLKVSGDLTFENIATKKSYALFEELHIKGNLYIHNIQKAQRIALKVFVDGDIEVSDCSQLLKIGEEVYVGGSASASDCPELKCFGNSGLIQNNLVVIDCDTFQKKITQTIKGKVSIE